MLRLTLIALAALASTCIDAQSWSVGNGNVTYQILFSKWQNPDGKTWTGSRCDQIGSKCDTRFICSVEPISCAKFDTRDYKLRVSWPGPVPMSQWRIVGESKYEENSLREFAYLNLTGVVGRDFCKAILRCQVVDVDPLSNDLIDEKVIILKGLQEINLPKFETDARFGVPLQGESISTAMPNYTRKGTVNLDAVQQHVFEVRVRAWGIDTSLGRRLSGGSSGLGSTNSLGSSAAGSGRDSSSSSSSHVHHHGTGGMHQGFDYATPYQSSASGRYNSSYPRQSPTGGNGLGSGAFNNTNRYYGGNTQTYSQVGGSQQQSTSDHNTKDDMFRRRTNSK